MPEGYSFHIGLNHVDPNAYNGWDGRLAGCVNDASAMRQICNSMNFTSQTFLDEEATADAIIGAIGQAAFNLRTGDTFVISYSGHGGEVPDETGDSETGLDQTWVAFDRMIVDHELYNLWGQFDPGVRIQVYSDSCHSGTVVRELLMQNGTVRLPTAAPPALAWISGSTARRNLRSVFSKAAQLRPSRAEPTSGLASQVGSTRRVARFIPPALALAVYQRDRRMYSALQWSRRRTEIGATVTLISGCQDNQLSADGDNNGLFTEKLLRVWDNGNFSGNLPQFHKAILALMPSDQTPNYLEVGTHDSVFTASRPLTVVGSGSDVVVPDEEEPVTPATPEEDRPPMVTGPETYDRNLENPPIFSVDRGSNAYYIFEITNNTELFGNDADRSSSSFSGSWNDSDAEARY
jgi:metacaspase-1